MLESCERSLNFQSIEHLNSFTYYNYGEVLSANCSDLSESNRLAVCTDKCILILNYNFMWPLSVVNCTPAKFLNDLNPEPKVSQNISSGPSALRNTDKSKLQIDSWKRDLNEARNESFFLNVIHTVKKSKAILDVYLNFFKIEEITKRHKSFHQNLIDMVINKNNFNNQIKAEVNADSQCVETSLDSLAQSCSEQYSLHKRLSDQTIMYDAYYCEYLGYLNSLKQNQTNLSSIFESGFKRVKWNSNLYSHLLCAITNCNQLLLFDCSKLNEDNNANLLDNEHEKTTEAFENFFDTKSESKYFNLTEMWLKEYNFDMIDFVPKTINDFFLNLNRITPTFVHWSSTFKVEIKSDDYVVFEMLFVSFKSNQIAVFIVYKSKTEEDISIKLYDWINANDKINLEISNLQDEFINVDLNRNTSNTFITCLNFWSGSEDINDSSYGLLEIGTQNGIILIKKISLNSKKIQNLINDQEKKRIEIDAAKSENDLFTLKSILNNSGQINSLDLILLDNSENLKTFLFLLEKENCIKFTLVTFDLKNNAFKELENSSLNVDLKQVKSVSESNNVIKNYFKLISLKLTNMNKLSDSLFELEFLLAFENLLIDSFRLKIEKDKLTQIDQSNEPFRLKATASSEFKQDANDLLRMTQQSFLSTNNYILYQIDYFPQAMLVLKRSPQFQINVYRMKPHQNILTSFIRTEKYLNPKLELNDLIWLFKINLYLKQEYFFDEATFEFFFQCIKSSQEFLNTSSLKKDQNQIISNFKRLRILCIILGDYFERVSSFDFECIKSKETTNDSEDDPDTENDSEDVDDDDESVQSKDMEEELTKTKINNSATTNDSSKIIRTTSYYRSMEKEYTLNIFKFFMMDFITTVLKIGIQKLSSSERLILDFYCNFALKKNFSFDEITLKKLIKDNKSSKAFDLTSILKILKCDLCGENFNFEKSLEMNFLNCEMGHSVSRCQKSLLPLNSLYFRKCGLCSSTWNYFNKDDFPNFNRLIEHQNNCFLCD